MLNNLGSTTDIEMNILAKELINQLKQDLNITIERIVQGKVMASLEMHGFSVTVLNLTNLPEEL